MCRRGSPRLPSLHPYASGSLTLAGDRVAMKNVEPPPTKPEAKPRHYVDDFYDLLNTEVPVLADGKEIMVTNQRAILMKTIADARSGNQRAVKNVFEFLRNHPVPERVEFRMTSTAHEMLERFRKDAEDSGYSECDLV